MLLPHALLAITAGATLAAVVALGSMIGAMLPFLLRRFGADAASASAPLVATLVDVAGLSVGVGVAYAILRGARP